MSGTPGMLTMIVSGGLLGANGMRCITRVEAPQPSFELTRGAAGLLEEARVLLTSLEKLVELGAEASFLGTAHSLARSIDSSARAIGGEAGVLAPTIDAARLGVLTSEQKLAVGELEELMRRDLELLTRLHEAAKEHLAAQLEGKDAPVVAVLEERLEEDVVRAEETAGALKELRSKSS